MGRVKHLPALKEGKRQKSNFLCGHRDITKTWQVQTRIVQGASSCPEGSEQFGLSVLKYKELKPDEIHNQGNVFTLKRQG